MGFLLKRTHAHLSLEGVQLAPPRAQQSKARPEDAVRGAHRQQQLLALFEQRLQREEGRLGAKGPVLFVLFRFQGRTRAEGEQKVTIVVGTVG